MQMRTSASAVAQEKWSRLGVSTLARVEGGRAEETRATHDDRQVLSRVPRRRHDFDERGDLVWDLLAPVVTNPLAIWRHVDIEAHNDG